MSDMNLTEVDALAMVASRLRERFHSVPPDTIDAVVADCHRGYEGSPIREFIPLLVEREARALLSGRIPRQRQPSTDHAEPR